MNKALIINEDRSFSILELSPQLQEIKNSTQNYIHQRPINSEGRDEKQFNNENEEDHSTEKFYLDELLENQEYSVAIIPGVWVSSFELDLPEGYPAQMDKVIAYAIEEKIAQDIDEIHFFYVLIGAHKAVAYVIDKNKMSWLHQIFTTKNIYIHKLVPDYLLLPEEFPVSCFYRFNQYILYRQNKWLGCSLPNISSEITFEGRTYHCQDFDLLHSLSFEVSSLPVNLLTKEFYLNKPKTTAIKTWRLTGKIFGFGLAFIFFINLIFYYILLYQNNNKQEKIDQLYVQIFPKAALTDAPLLKIKEALNNQDQQQLDKGFLSIIRQISPVFIQQKTIKIEQLNFYNQELTLLFTLKSDNELRQLLQNLHATTLFIKEDFVKEQAQAIQVQIRLRLKV